MEGEGATERPWHGEGEGQVKESNEPNSDLFELESLQLALDDTELPLTTVAGLAPPRRQRSCHGDGRTVCWIPQMENLCIACVNALEHACTLALSLT